MSEVQREREREFMITCMYYVHPMRSMSCIELRIIGAYVLFTL